MLNDKRPGYYQGNDGLPTKKPRISHYKKSETNSGSSNLGDNGRTAGSGGGGGGSSGGGGGGDGGETSECAVVSKKEVEKRTATGERAANKLPGRSQRQVKQRRRG